MAEIAFFATDDDCNAIWAVVLGELGLIAYPDPWFGESPAPSLTTLAAIRSNLELYPRVAPGLGYFLTSAEWSREPLEYRLCKDNPNFKPYWLVNQRYGGPSIHFIPRFGYPRNQETHQIIAGLFSDYSHYYSVRDHRQVIERPIALAATMRTIRQVLRTRGKIVRSENGRSAVALANALLAHTNGAVLRSGDIAYSSISSGRRTSR